jgi:hypothetical protein
MLSFFMTITFKLVYNPVSVTAGRDSKYGHSTEELMLRNTFCFHDCLKELSISLNHTQYPFLLQYQLQPPLSYLYIERRQIKATISDSTSPRHLFRAFVLGHKAHLNILSRHQTPSFLIKSQMQGLIRHHGICRTAFLPLQYIMKVRSLVLNRPEGSLRL